jgi:hypothetical protein
VNGATVEIFSELSASARMLNTATMIVWKRTRDSTLTSAVLKLMESSNKRLKET